ncbi:MAG: hypothetical protein OXD33_12855 [Rhodobacteraceae bacterium]|nr:hypothetical protein [Paracoccaceae bacterium]
MDTTDLAVAPRLSIVRQAGADKVVEEYYAVDKDAPALACPLANVRYVHLSPVAESWHSSVQAKIRPCSGLLAGLMNGLRIERFRPGKPRNLAPLFQDVVSRQVAMEIADPYCGISQKTRRSLADFVAAAIDAGAELSSLTITWNPDKGHAGTKTSQINSLQEELQSAGVQIKPKFNFRTGRLGHFHDRVVTARTTDTGGLMRLRLDITAGIDNLMSRSKECSVFIETMR